MAVNYAKKLHDEIDHVPQEYLPALLNIVHSFRESVSKKSQQDAIYNNKLETLRAAIIEGEQSGDVVSFNINEIVNEARQESGLNA